MLTTTRTKKPGRKPKHYRASDGREIHGLARDAKSGRWRVIATSKFFREEDEQRAIEKFTRLTGKATPISELHERGCYIPAAQYVGTLYHRISESVALRECRVMGILPGGDTAATGFDPDAVMWPIIGDFIRKYPKRAAEMAGVEQLGYLTNIKPPPPAPTVANITATWKQHARCSKEQVQKVARAWSDFAETTGMENVGEIDAELVVAYGDAVRNRGWSGKQQLHLFTGIRRILRFAKCRAMAIDIITGKLAILDVLKPSESITTLDPKPVERDDWNALLHAAEGDDPAMILLMLNGAFYLKEVINLEWADVKAGCIVTNRAKTGRCVRACVLWPETLDALANVKRRGEKIFYNYAGHPIAISGAQRRFTNLTEKANVPHVTGSMLRDGAYTAAVAAGVSEQISKLLVGHRCGLADNYVARRPAMVKPATDAVHAAYFGG